MNAALKAFAVLSLTLAPAFAQSPRLLAYYGYWDQWNVPPYTAANIPYQKVTHIVHSNIGPSNKADGSLAVPQAFYDPELISRAHAAGVRVEVCIAGSAYLFVTIDADPTLRATFAQNIANFAIAHGYDGVDFDYEVPYSEEQADNFTQLVADVRALLPAGQYLISAAVSSSPGGYGVYDFPGLTPLLDFYNVMTYDFHGAWTNHSGHNSPLYLSPLDPGQEGSLDTSVTEYTSIYAVPAEQINLGTAFYGYAFDVEGLWFFCANHNLCGNKGAPTVTYAQAEQLIKLGWTENWDDLADAPYLLDATFPTFGFITYDNPTSTTKKVQYAIGRKHLGGVFMWELSQDYNGTTQPLLDAMHTALMESSSSQIPAK